MSKLKVHSVSAVKTEKERKDNKKSREFLTVALADASNPFSPKVYIRNIFQRTLKSGDNSWGAMNPLALKQLEGTMIEGKVATVNVEPYIIKGDKPENDRTVSTFTTILFAGETIESVARQQGHKMAAALAPAIASEEEIQA